MPSSHRSAASQAAGRSRSPGTHAGHRRRPARLLHRGPGPRASGSSACHARRGGGWPKHRYRSQSSRFLCETSEPVACDLGAGGQNMAMIYRRASKVARARQPACTAGTRPARTPLRQHVMTGRHLPGVAVREPGDGMTEDGPDGRRTVRPGSPGSARRGLCVVPGDTGRGPVRARGRASWPSRAGGTGPPWRAPGGGGTTPWLSRPSTPRRGRPSRPTTR
jgi:hypothetical protein